MATSRDLGEFSRRMTVVSRAVAVGALKIVRGAALVADEAVVVGTPVDTGRARSNWITSLDAPVLDERPAPFDRSGQLSIDQAHEELADFRGGDIFITNNVPYIMPLEHGHSAQAPDGMAQQAVAEAAAYVHRTRVEMG